MASGQVEPFDLAFADMGEIVLHHLFAESRADIWQVVRLAREDADIGDVPLVARAAPGQIDEADLDNVRTGLAAICGRCGRRIKVDWRGGHAHGHILAVDLDRDGGLGLALKEGK